MERSKTGWERQTDGSWRYRVNGVPVKNAWKEINTVSGLQWFVFSGDRTMITGWLGNEAGDWYYLNPDDGAMLAAQWFEVNGKWYYAKMCIRDRYYPDAAGHPLPVGLDSAFED